MQTWHLWHFLSIGLLSIGCSGGEAVDGASRPNDITDQDGGQNGGTAAPTVPPTCIPKPGPDLPDDAFEDSNCDGIDGDRATAIFVSPSGSDDSTGTLEAPVRTLGKASTLAAAAGKYVLVANGVYPESLVLDESTAPPAIYGGYKDKTWQRVEDRAVVAPSSGVPLTIRGSGAPLTIDRMSFKAPVAFEPSGSSVAVFAVNSQPVTFTHATLEASRGAAGEGPPPPVTDTSPGPEMYGAPGLDAELSPVNSDACGTYAPIPAECYQPHLGGGAGTWQNGVGWGGPGGNGEYRTRMGERIPPTNGSKGGLAGGGAGGVKYAYDESINDNAVVGSPGAEGASGISGQPGSALGVVTENGYTAANNGTPGSAGSGGAGGGGGAGGLTATCWNGELPSDNWLVGIGGGQGGHGGRGGQGAPGSSAGGASIGLLIFHTDVSLVSSTITTASGGRGADAVPGADGQEGGAGGWGGYRIPSCTYGKAIFFERGFAGGPGGRGGMGGAGGAGGGGPSMGILSSSGSPIPKIQSVTINLGAGGKGGFGIEAPNAADGLTKEIHQIGGVTP